MTGGTTAVENGTQDAGLLVDGLTHRLAQGFGTVLNEGREHLASTHDTPNWSKADLSTALRGLLHVQTDGGLTNAQRTLTAYWDEHPEAVRTLLHRPGDFLAHLPALVAVSDPNVSGPAPLKEGERWRLFAVCADLLWGYLHGDTPQAHKHRHLLPLATRTRFLALSEPFRHPDHPLWTDLRINVGDLYRIFGDMPWPELARRAREARQIWRDHLNGHQSIPLFDHAPPTAVEDELRALVLTTATGFSGDPLVLDAPDAARVRENTKASAPAGEESTGQERVPAIPVAERALLEEAVEQHLLPRFAVGRVWAITLGLRRSHLPIAQFVLLTVVAVCAAGAFISTIWALFGEDTTFLPALVLAATTYVLIGVGTLWFGRLWVMPLMLRLPAAAAVGMIVLVALHPDWWTNIRPGPLLYALLALLGGSSLGYLLIEARNHNSGQLPARPGPAFGALARIGGRALSVALTGLAHAFLIALLGMAVIAPVFSEEGVRLTVAWTGTPQDAENDAGEHGSDTASAPEPAEDTETPKQEPPRSPGEPWTILVAATFWCLAAGVFSQILWDDQPITAPLAHRRWRKER